MCRPQLCSVSPLRRVIICGATGHLGNYITKGLLEARYDFDVSILLRERTCKEASKQAVVSVLESRGASVVFVPECSYTLDCLGELLRGYDCVISAVGHTAVESQYILLGAAQRAGVRRFIPSSFGFDIDKLPLGVFHMWDTKRAFHEAVVNSGVEYTIISNGVFFETFFTPFFGFDRHKREVHIKGNPDVKFSATSFSDMANWVPRILLDPASANAKVNCCGQLVSMREAVDCFQEVSGETFRVTVEGFGGGPQAAALSDSIQRDCWSDLPERIQFCVSQGLATVDDAWNVARGQRAVSLREFAERVVSSRLPVLTYLALREEKTKHSPSHQRLVRSTNAILIESVLSDEFPWPVLAA